MIPLTRAKIIAYLAGIFAAGAVSGGFIGAGVSKKISRPPARREFMTSYRKRICEKVNASPEQMKQIDPILQRRGGEIRHLREKAEGDINAAIRQMNEEVGSILTAEQRSRLELMDADRKDHDRKEFEKRTHSH